MEKTAVVALYGYLDGYPSSLYTVNLLRNHYAKVIVICRKSQSDLSPVLRDGVELVEIAPYYDHTTWVNLSLLLRLKTFYQFTLALSKAIRICRPKLILMYDPYPVLSYFLVKKFGKIKATCWYHNHDLLSSENTFSLSGLAVYAEKKEIGKFNYFTLPTKDRKQYFPLTNFHGKYHLIPNYPSIEFYNRFYLAEKQISNSPLRIIYQGSIGTKRGFEELTKFLSHHAHVFSKGYELVLKGYIAPDYKNTLLDLATNLAIADKILFAGYTEYIKVPALAANCHVGWGVQYSDETTYTTLGTSSNKIFEYAALGLPVILYDNFHFREHYQKYPWCFFTDLSVASLLNIFSTIQENYVQLSQQARHDFSNELNFENIIVPFISEVFYANEVTTV